MAIRLIVMDLDGTLLTSEKMVSDYSKDVLRRAMEKGVAVTLATGRMLLSASYFGRIIGANAPIISCNGALVQALDATEPLFLRAFSPETVAELLTFARENGWYAQWYIGDDIYAEDFRPEYFTAYRTVQGFAVHEVGEDFSPYVEGVAQVVVRDLAGGVGAIAASIRSSRRATHSTLCRRAYRKRRASRRSCVRRASGPMRSWHVATRTMTFPCCVSQVRVSSRRTDRRKRRRSRHTLRRAATRTAWQGRSRSLFFRG